MGKPISPARETRISLRSVLLGLLLIPPHCYWVVVMEQVRLSGHPTTISLFFHAVFTLLLLLTVNAGLRRLWPRVALGRAELLTVYAILCAGTGVAGHDTMQVFLPSWAHPTWFATPENRWEALFLRDLPKPLIVQDKAALEGFYGGHSSLYEAAHWRAWLRPVLIWSSFLTLVYWGMLSLNVFLRRQWTEREKLSFPLIQLPLDMTAPGRAFWGSKVFWFGFALAAGADALNGLHYLYPFVPGIHLKVWNIQGWLPPGPWQAIGWTPVSFYPFALGIGFLLPTDLSFSCWFFYLFFKLQIIAGAFFGWSGSMGYEGVQGGLPFVVEQGIGGYLALFAFAMWAARGHLGEVWRGGKGEKGEERGRKGREGEGRGEKGAVLGFGVCLVALLAFSRYVGFSLGLAGLFFALYYILMTTITKIRAELGPPVHDLHFGGPDRIIATWFGSANLAKGDLIGLSFYFGFNRAYRGIPMPHQLEAFRLADRLQANRRRMAWALFLAAPVGVLSACWAILHLGYHYGLVTMTECRRFGGQGWDRLAGWLTQPWEANTVATLAMALGMAFASGLLWLRLRFVGFPFHPIGYAISANWAMNCVWLPLCLSWLAKVLVMRYTGARGYRAAVPFALGLILGEFVVGSLWALIGVVLDIPTYGFWIF